MSFLCPVSLSNSKLSFLFINTYASIPHTDFNILGDVCRIIHWFYLQRNDKETEQKSHGLVWHIFLFSKFQRKPMSLKLRHQLVIRSSWEIRNIAIVYPVWQLKCHQAILCYSKHTTSTTHSVAAPLISFISPNGIIWRSDDIASCYLRPYWRGNALHLPTWT